VERGKPAFWPFLLHNRNTFAFNRLELQSVKFSLSQFGEDLAILGVVKQLGLRKGTYVDAGAYHPIFGSNTLLLHKQGWRGINVDLAAQRIATFARIASSETGKESRPLYPGSGRRDI
jgi:hypothetical protein